MTLEREIYRDEGLMRGLIDEAIGTLNSTQISMIKDGIEQHGVIGFYGRSFIATAIIEKLRVLKE